MSLVISLLPFNHSQSNLLHLFNIFIKTFYSNMNKGIPIPKLNIAKTKQVTDAYVNFAYFFKSAFQYKLIQFKKVDSYVI
ncbi:hypothetical protein GCM10008921_09400 [Metaclostridioides mangenotii]